MGTKRRSIVGIPRLKTLCEIAAMEVPNLKGEIAEVGVYKGGSAKALADLFPDRRMLLFDTFEGIPSEKLESQDNPKLSGRFADTSLEDVQQYLKGNVNCEFYSGLFPESLNQLNDKNIQFALVHVDCDLYRTILDCCEFFYPRMAKGGLIFFDDYSWLSGARKAVHQFFSDKPEKLIRPDFKSTGGTCYVRKT
jgi:predicted O-methyltransferase YrrM